MDNAEALRALDEMVSALRALLPGAESMGWDTGNARTAISNSEIIRAHLTDPGYVRVPVEPTAEMIRKGQGQWSGESMVEIYKAMLAAATKETSHD